MTALVYGGASATDIRRAIDYNRRRVGGWSIRSYYTGPQDPRLERDVRNYQLLKRAEEREVQVDGALGPQVLALLANDLNYALAHSILDEWAINLNLHQWRQRVSFPDGMIGAGIVHPVPATRRPLRAAVAAPSEQSILPDADASFKNVEAVEASGFTLHPPYTGAGDLKLVSDIWDLQQALGMQPLYGRGVLDEATAEVILRLHAGAGNPAFMASPLGRRLHAGIRPIKKRWPWFVGAAVAVVGGVVLYKRRQTSKTATRASMPAPARANYPDALIMDEDPRSRYNPGAYADTPDEIVLDGYIDVLEPDGADEVDAFDVDEADPGE